MKTYITPTYVVVTISRNDVIATSTGSQNLVDAVGSNCGLGLDNSGASIVVGGRAADRYFEDW